VNGLSVATISGGKNGISTTYHVTGSSSVVGTNLMSVDITVSWSGGSLTGVFQVEYQ
jgi:hypothetical protein